ncbi:STAS domain-containing protein (plasmid) [Deinococcus sp. KNUC1210]|uniref:STAS domain-containing protein n=1 Tax=Deinococcus sp. KNUC1210 TaxID=2917691 RepID=UPI001EEFDC46|nr:STAS domain-containing protein [Deinococcus sp. KNUC1210]ULH17502.1 STAS domain-containing protein [Deinococcus sp. KNUC1210]
MSIPNLTRLLQNDAEQLLQDWLKAQLASGTLRRDLLSEVDLRRDSQAFLTAFVQALGAGAALTTDGPAWEDVKAVLAGLSKTRASQGFTSGEVATFVLSLKQPLFNRLFTALSSSPEQLQDDLWTTTVLLDQLGLYTLEVYQRSREDIILRQRQELLELSTPVVKVWQGIVALPLIGTLDSERTQVVMESLLERIVETESTVAIIDITGVPTVDTLVAQHLLRAVAAARLMGAECIISGIRPQIAQTIVHLGIDLSSVTTKANFADAIALALTRSGFQVTRARAQ